MTDGLTTKVKMALLFVAVAVLNAFGFLCMVVLVLMHPREFIREQRRRREA